MKDRSLAKNCGSDLLGPYTLHRYKNVPWISTLRPRKLSSGSLSSEVTEKLILLFIRIPTPLLFILELWKKLYDPYGFILNVSAIFLRLMFRLSCAGNLFQGFLKVLQIRTLKRVIFLKVPKREIFDRSDFPDFYTLKSSWVGDLLVKIWTYYFNFWES